MPCEQIDWLVLTAVNEAQARVYRSQLEARERDGRLNGVGRWMVVPDPPGDRIGSGGSTLLVLRALARAAGDRPFLRWLNVQRILLIHSGGESRRLPAFAAQGKIFAPVPHPRKMQTPVPLLDLLIEDLRGLASRSRGRVTVATGDVYLGVREHGLDLAGEDVMGVAFPGDVQRAGRHGVYALDRRRRVRLVLQKPSEAILRSSGALMPDGQALIDTGIVSLSPRAVSRWLRWADRHDQPKALDLYADVLPAMVTSSARLKGGPGDALRLGTLGVCVMPSSPFVHIGSSRELLDAWTRTPEQGLWLDSVAMGRRRGARPVAGCVVEGSILSNRVQLAKSTMCVGLPRIRESLRLPRGVGVVALPVGRSSWACVVFGINDDFKTPIHAGGTFAGKRLRALATRAGNEEVLWPHQAIERTLWNARLWVVGRIDRVIREQAWLFDTNAQAAPRAWIKARRFSVAELLGSARVNHRRMLRHRELLRAASFPETIVTRALADQNRPSSEWAQELRTRPEMATALQTIEHAVPALPPLTGSRMLWIARDIRARLSSRSSGGVKAVGVLESRAFASIARVVISKESPEVPPDHWAVSMGQGICCESPLRIDLAGGWSDTPPICQERGGSVVNAAITLEGIRPIRVCTTIIEEPVVRVISEDQARTLTLRTSRDVHAPLVPSDWSSLARAGLVLAGVAPTNAGGSLRKRLDRLGGGLELSLRSNAPKGSGLGASSILGATLLACLDRTLGRGTGPDLQSRVVSRTLAVEQMMGTGGGWQDQAGGVTPGIKIIRTEPGQLQCPVIEPIDARRTMPGLRGRMLLYFTGYQRLAANVLRGVVARYLARDRTLLRTIDELKAGAERMREDLLRGDARAFAQGLADYWRLKRAIDPGATTPAIEALIASIDHDLEAYELPGAGGGGFLFMIAKSEKAAERVRRRLSDHPPTRSSRLFEFAIDDHGLVGGHLR